jgi:two-component system CheB/CheR fusion protein
LTPVVGIVASAGGLAALKKFFTAVPADSGFVFIVVPHLDPTHESLMADLLSRCTAMPVVEANDQAEILANHVYVIPPNNYLSLKNRRLQLTGPVKRHDASTAIDPFLRSLAADCQELAIGIVLSGTGHHGTPGVTEIKAVGGMTMVQDPATAEYGAMPASAIRANVADYVLPVESMPQVLTDYFQVLQANDIANPETLSEQDRTQLDEVLNILWTKCKHDFRCYRKGMVKRRILHRMGLCQIDRLQRYLELLRAKDSEAAQLCKDLLISVTSFFRDPEAFHVLDKEVIQDLVRSKDVAAPLRVWISGCATGEEAYSIAMLLIDAMKEAKTNPHLQLFASDVDSEALESARQGVYPPHDRRRSKRRPAGTFFQAHGRSALVSSRQVAARIGRVCRPEPDRRPSVLEVGSDRLPQPADLPRAGSAEEDPETVPFRPERRRLPVPGLLGNDRPRGGFVRADLKALADLSTNRPIAPQSG